MQENYAYHHRECARRLRAQATPAEQQLWQYLRKRQVAGLKFRRQAPIGRYIVDFVCFERKLVVELDGGIHLNQRAYDAVRDTWLKSQGFIVLRIWNQQLREQPNIVLATIQRLLNDPT